MELENVPSDSPVFHIALKEEEESIAQFATKLQVLKKKVKKIKETEQGMFRLEFTYSLFSFIALVR